MRRASLLLEESPKMNDAMTFQNESEEAIDVLDGETGV